MPIHRLHRVIAVLLLVLSGCASHKTHDAAHPFSAGWRKGKVVAIDTEQGLPRAPFRDCRDDGSVRAPQTRYARLEYRGTQLREWRIVPLLESQSLRPGDTVYVQINDCNAPVDQAGSP